VLEARGKRIEEGGAGRLLGEDQPGNNRHHVIKQQTWRISQKYESLITISIREGEKSSKSCWNGEVVNRGKGQRRQVRKKNGRYPEFLFSPKPTSTEGELAKNLSREKKTFSHLLWGKVVYEREKKHKGEREIVMTTVWSKGESRMAGMLLGNS